MGIRRRLLNAEACCRFPLDSLLSTAEDWEVFGSQQGCIAESYSRL
jgi:hypothetical protein